MSVYPIMAQTQKETMLEDFLRTSKQNNSLHKYCELVAKALNDAGLDIEKVITQYEIGIPWTKMSVKELLWKTIQKSMFDKDSTRKLSRVEEINEIFEVLNRFLAKLGIESIPFPSAKDNG